MAGAQEEEQSWLEPGDRIDHYEVVDEVGRGAIGIVVRALDTELGREVALKVLRRQSSPRQDGRLLEEARAMAKLTHNNVVKVHAVGEHELGVYIAMELVRGTTLRRWSEGAAHSWQEVVEIWLRAGAGLVAAHESGVIHGDFKPDNVLVSDDGRVLVTDFGLAGAGIDRTGPVSVEEVSVDASLTLTGIAMGTPRFMGPEMLDGRASDARSDQFAFGVSLCRALYGSYPFSGGSVAELRRSVAEGPSKNAPGESDAPSALWSILRRALAVDPADRYPRMRSMLARLQRVLDGRHGRRRGLTLAAVAGLGLAVGTAAVIAVDPWPCREAGDALDAAWDSEYAKSWREAARDACLAAQHSDAEPMVVEARRDCLERAKAALVSEADELPELDVCADPPTHEPAGAPKLTKEFYAAWDAFEAGNFMEADQMLQALLDANDDPHLVSWALLLRAKIAIEDKRVDDAERYGVRASAIAVDAHSDKLDAEVALFLAQLYGRTTRLPESRAQLEAARVAIKRLGDPPALRVPFAIHRSWMLRSAGHLEEAAKASTEALELIEGTNYESSRATILQARAGDYNRLRRFDDALPDVLAACEITLREHGKHHPDYVQALETHAETLMYGGRYDEAEEVLRKAIQLAEEGLENSDAAVAGMEYRLGGIAEAQHRYEQAKEHLERALELHEPRRADPALAMNAHDKLSYVSSRLGDHAAARRHADAALEIGRERMSEDEPYLGGFIWTRGDAEFHAGEYARALPYFQRAAEVIGPEGALYPECIARVGETMVELEHPDAMGTVERSLELLSDRLPTHRAEMEFARARLLARKGDKGQALELAVKAESVIAAEDHPDPATLGRIRRFIAAQR